jgi:phosphoribosylamine--glycine ligase
MSTRILILGSGGREHALALALSTAGSDAVDLLCAPGNPGIAECATLIPIAGDDVAAVVQAARAHAVDWVIPGGESWLCAGLADALAAAGIACIGPSRQAAQLEASKVFARTLTAPLGVPSPRFVVVRSEEALRDALARWQGLPVIKADGLAAGKGVFLPDSIEECLDVGRALLAGSLGEAGKTLLIEERLHGEEASLFFACAGRDVLPLSHARDHKRLLDGDRGPNTGGMGAISPSPICTPAIEREVQERIVRPTLQALVERGTPFVGFLFVGILQTEAGPSLLEFNVRWGDPEAQAVLPRLGDGDLFRLCQAMVAGQLRAAIPTISAQASCAVVLAAAGYPQAPRRGDVIAIEEGACEKSGAHILHSGTQRLGPLLTTAGGRVLTVVALAPDGETARRRAYQGADAVHFAGLQRREDIGGAWAASLPHGETSKMHTLSEPVAPRVGVIMGSQSDWAVMQHAARLLDALGIAHEARVVSAHRTPQAMVEYAQSAQARGLSVLIAGAGGAAHLPGMVASLTLLPVLGVPIPVGSLSGLDALLSIVQMPRGVPVGTLAVGEAGASNAALLAAEILALYDPALRDRLRAYREARRDEVLAMRLPPGGDR